MQKPPGGNHIDHLVDDRLDLSYWRHLQKQCKTAQNKWDTVLKKNASTGFTLWPSTTTGLAQGQLSIYMKNWEKYIVFSCRTDSPMLRWREGWFNVCWKPRGKIPDFMEVVWISKGTQWSVAYREKAWLQSRTRSHCKVWANTQQGEGSVVTQALVFGGTINKPYLHGQSIC